MSHILTPITALLLLRLAGPAQEPAATAGSPSQAKPSAESPKQAVSKPFLWRVQNPGGKTCYAFGSIHLPDKRVVTGWPRPLKEIFRKADAVYFEIPFDDETLVKAGAAMRAPGGSLAKVLPEDLYSRAEAKLKQIAPTIGMGQFDALPPTAFGVTLLGLEGAEQSSVAMDLLLYKQMAHFPGKTVGGLETVEEQSAAFHCLTPDEEIEVLRATLDHMDACKERDTSARDELINAYLGGDLEELTASLKRSMRGCSEATVRKFNDALLTNRNRRLAGRIANRMRECNNQAQVFVLGAAHYAEPDGVLDLLRKEGFSVSRVIDLQ